MQRKGFHAKYPAGFVLFVVGETDNGFAGVRVELGDRLDVSVNVGGLDGRYLESAGDLVGSPPSPFAVFRLRRGFDGFTLVALVAVEYVGCGFVSPSTAGLVDDGVV